MNIKDTTYINNIEYLKKSGWNYIGDKYSNGICELYCSEIKEISNEVFFNLIKNTINPLCNEIKELKQDIKELNKYIKEL